MVVLCLVRIIVSGIMFELLILMKKNGVGKVGFVLFMMVCY